MELRPLRAVLRLRPVEHVVPGLLALVVVAGVVLVPPFAILDLPGDFLPPLLEDLFGNLRADVTQEAHFLRVTGHIERRVHRGAFVALDQDEAIRVAVGEPFLGRLGSQRDAQRLAVGNLVASLGEREHGRRRHVVVLLTKRQHKLLSNSASTRDRRWEQRAPSMRARARVCVPRPGGRTVLGGARGVACEFGCLCLAREPQAQCRV